MGEEAWWHESAAVYADYIDLVSLIGTISLSFFSREANHVAHGIAIFSFSNEDSCNWLDDAPSFILSKLINDVILVGN
jgi:hypothetical protein